MQTITSADGTRIAYETHGDGQPLVLVHGGSETRHSWDALRPQLAEEFEVVVPDRRGRGGSGDADAYSLDREVADLRALVETIDGEVSVFGHSFGGLVALAAAPELDVDRLVLYEPPLLAGDHIDDLSDQMRERLEHGGRAAAMKLFYREDAGIPDPEQLPIWPDRIRFDLTETVIRERAAVEAFDADAVPSVDCPTLLLTGEHSPSHLRDDSRVLAAALSDSRLVEIDGAGHIGVQTAPDQIAAAMRSFRQEAPVRQ